MAISRASLIWGNDGLPRAAAFDDVYFSVHDPVAETEHVFLRGNKLKERFADASRSSLRFVIAETGFGTGLNFISTWALWNKVVGVNSKSCLHFVSMEQFPLSLEDLQRAHARWQSNDEEYYIALQQKYPVLTEGVHHLVFDGGRVRLTLLFGDATQMLIAMQETMQGKVNAWFLDGFAPAKNAAMWTPKLYEQVMRASVPEATVASFTAAGDVRRGLQAVGFEVSKVRGHGHKRDMTVAYCALSDGAMPLQKKTQRVKKVVVIGGGIAGTSAAYALARRGFQVTLLEQHAKVGAEASGNPAGILFPMMHKSWSDPMRFYAQGFSYTRQLLQELRAFGRDVEGEFCGMVQIPKVTSLGADIRFVEVMEKLCPDPSFVQYKDARELSEISGITLENAGYYFPQGGWVNVPALCHALTRHPLIDVVYHARAERLEKESDAAWCVAYVDARSTERCEVSAHHVVVANALDAMRLLPEMVLPLHTIQGQVSFVPETKRSASLRTVLCYGGYITPAFKGKHSIGATYEHARKDCVVDEMGHLRNLEDSDTHIPFLQLLQSHQVNALSGRAALRTVSKDRLPLVGKLVDSSVYHGISLTVAHASRGLLSAPLAGELIASQLDTDMVMVDDAVAKMLNPLRFCTL